MTATPVQEQPTAYINARLMDPASGLDTPGSLLSLNGKIADLGANLFSGGVPDSIQTVDCSGNILAISRGSRRNNVRSCAASIAFNVAIRLLEKRNSM